jgi:hypothetical protein
LDLARLYDIGLRFLDFVLEEQAQWGVVTVSFGCGVASYVGVGTSAMSKILMMNILVDFNFVRAQGIICTAFSIIYVWCIL